MKKRLWLFLIILIALFLRIYRLNSNPYNFQKNEAFKGVNAFFLLKTGRDINGKLFPLVFNNPESKDDFHLPAYIYLATPAVALFGLNEFSVRFPSAFFGTLTVFLSYFLVKELFKKEPFVNCLSLITAFLLTISPWHIHFSRQASGATLSLFFIVLAVYLFLKEKEKQSFLFFLLSILSFKDHWLFVIFLSGFLFLKKKKFFYPLAVYLLVFFLFQITTFKKELIFSTIFFDDYFTGLTFFEKIYQLVKNYFSYFSFEFLFFDGDPNINHSVGEMGEFHLFALPLLLIGIYQLFQQRYPLKKILFGWWFLSFLQPAFYRYIDSEKSFVAVMPLTILTALGMVKVLESISKFKKGVLRFVVYGFLFTVCFYNLLSFLHLYLVHYFKRTQNQEEAGYKKMLLFVKEKKDTYEKVYIDGSLGAASFYTLFYLKYPPADFRKRGHLKAFGKFLVGKEPRKGEERVLFITSFHREEVKGFRKIQDFRLLNNSLIFSAWGN